MNNSLRFIYLLRLRLDQFLKNQKNQIQKHTNEKIKKSWEFQDFCLNQIFDFLMLADLRINKI